MPRTKDFDADDALQSALAVFWDKGYDGASLPDLLDAMGIGRQSLYDTFGDKQALYRTALETYRQQGMAWITTHLNDTVDPVAGIRTLLMGMVERDPQTCQRGCMLMNAAGDAGRDPVTAELVQTHIDTLTSAFQAQVARGQAAGAITKGTSAKALAHHLLITFLGLMTAGRVGVDRAARRHAVESAMAVLTG